MSFENVNVVSWILLHQPKSNMREGGMYMTAKRSLKFGAIVHGVGGSMTTWRHPEVQPDASVNFEFYKRQTLKAEEGKFDLVLLPMVCTSPKNPFPTS